MHGDGDNDGNGETHEACSSARNGSCHNTPRQGGCLLALGVNAYARAHLIHLIVISCKT